MAVQGLESSSGWLGSIVEIFSSVIRIFLYLIPILLIVGVTAGTIYYTQFRRKFNVDVIIKVIANNNLVITQDRGGVFKNSLGNDEFRLLKSKVFLPIPNRAKFWMLNNKGRFNIEFLKVGESDYLPIQNKIPFKDIMFPKYKDAKGTLVPIDTKKKMEEALEKLEYKPIPSQSKSFHQMKTKENIIKFQRSTRLEKLYPIIGIMIVAGLLVFVGITYFKYAERIIDKGIASTKDCMVEGQKLLKDCNAVCLQGRPITPPENIPPNPLLEEPPV